MIKVLPVGDLHGKYVMVERAAKRFLEGNFDYLIFMGDYVDSKYYTFKEQIMCIDAVNELTSTFDNVIALIGNHDQPNYIYNHICSGFNAAYETSFRLAFEAGRFQVAWQHENWLFTHAGLTRGWMLHNMNHLTWVSHQTGAVNLADKLNALYDTHRRSVLFQVSHRRGGTSNNGGPLWADKLETWTKPIFAMNQVVGHTRTDCIVKHVVGDRTIYYVDCLKEEEDDDFNFLTLEI